MTKVLLIGLLLGLLWAVYKLFLTGKRQSLQTELPAELAGARIWAKERQFECSGDAPMVGRIDEGFELPNGDLVASDTKSRARPAIYPSDVLTVSAYKYLIEESTGKRVTEHGYIRLITPGGNEYRRIRLLDRTEVLAARQLHEDLTRGLYAGDKCGNQAICRTCAYKPECNKMA